MDENKRRVIVKWADVCKDASFKQRHSFFPGMTYWELYRMDSPDGKKILGGFPYAGEIVVYTKPQPPAQPNQTIDGYEYRLVPVES